MEHIISNKAFIIQINQYRHGPMYEINIYFFEIKQKEKLRHLLKACELQDFIHPQKSLWDQLMAKKSMREVTSKVTST